MIALKAVKTLLMPSRRWNAVPASLASCYNYKGSCGNDGLDTDWMNSMLLSPRSCFVLSTDGRRKEGFAICAKCKSSLHKKEMPRFAIADNYTVGSPPPCLLALSDIELAMLTPVKTYGYCFAFTVGANKQLKGSLSYFKVALSR